jgi:hypothetical protein
MAILRSLKLDGTFCYSPDLPFIESLLPPTEYDVRKIPAELSDGQYQNMHSLILDEPLLFYADTQNQLKQPRLHLTGFIYASVL